MKDNNKKQKRNPKQPRKEGDNQAAAVNGNNFAHIEPVQAQPLEVKVYNNNFDKAFRAFRALVQKERILSVYKERQSFEKPSDRRRRKRNEMSRKRQELGSAQNRNERTKSFKQRSGDYSE